MSGGFVVLAMLMWSVAAQAVPTDTTVEITDTTTASSPDVEEGTPPDSTPVIITGPPPATTPSSDRQPSWLYEWQTLIGAFLSGFLAFGVVALWEGWLAPARVGRNVATALIGETSINIQLLGGQRAARQHNPNAVPADFRLSHIGFDTLGERIAELPPEVLNRVLLFYGRIRTLNEMPRLYAEILEQYRNADPRSHVKDVIQQELDSVITVFYQYLDSSIEHASALQRSLRGVAERGTWKRIKPSTLSADELDAKVAGLMARQREEIAKRRATRQSKP